MVTILIKTLFESNYSVSASKRLQRERGIKETSKGRDIQWPHISLHVRPVT